MRRNLTIEEQLCKLSFDSVKEVTGDLPLLDSETKQRILDRTLRRVGMVPDADVAKGRSRKGGTVLMRNQSKFRKPAVAAAAVLLACSLGVGSIAAAGALNKTFGQYFQTLSESHYEDQLFDVNQSASDNGVTVTITQAMCDGNALYVIERTEFDPSVLVLTDKMFEEHGGYMSAPRWNYDQLINVKETDEYELKDIGGVIERMSSFSRLLEHDTHSMTWLRVYGGGDDFSSKADSFFTDGKQFLLRYSGIDHFPGKELREPYDCRIEIAFEMKKVSKPNCYTLPEEVYSFTQTTDDDIADMVITPWYMNFSGASATGKVLDTTLKETGVPEIEVTMKDGTSYTENNGISMAKEYLGEDYSAFAYFRCDFDTPVDIGNIRSIKIYGHEMKKGKVTADKSKEKTYENKDGVKILPATSPVTVSDEWKEVNYQWHQDGPSYGRFRYRVKDVKVYDNAYATGAKNEDELMDVPLECWDSSKWNPQTGRLGEDMYLLEYEVELTNIDANFSESLGTFDFNHTGYFEDLFGLRMYNGNRPYPDYGGLLYIRENEYEVTGQRHSIRLDRGDTRTFHVSFAVHDNHAGGLEQAAFYLCSNQEEDNMTYINLGRIVEELKQGKEK